MTFDMTINVGQIVTALIAIVAAAIAIRQIGIQTRNHILEIYRQVFRMIDDIRPERHLLRDLNSPELNPKLYEDEFWLDGATNSNPQWKAHWEAAEKVFRVFDQLGLLIRKERIPLDPVARFYVVPTIQAWYHLAPYVVAVRAEKRGQPSHGWHFENLVYEIILPGLSSGWKDRGIWRLVRAHDFPKDSTETSPNNKMLEKVKNDRPPLPHTAPGYSSWLDSRFARCRLWKLRLWYL